MIAQAIGSLIPAGKARFDITPATRGLIGVAGVIMTLLSIYGLLRLALGLAPAHPNLREVAIVLHVATVVPAIPLGGFLLLARKGTALHKRLGKIWVAMMIVTALSAIFIQTGGGLSFIHIFVPVTLIGAWEAVATARSGKITEHKKHLVGMYLGALMIPGVLAFALPGRVMNVLVFGW